ncbi:DUF2085 domain-containing protein [Ureibacillus aquaedulcis]|uniref:DUF2085 domain-containing protein n=1 Tax=Ureibacillus aquaedulcis TaxID=3058421 RepID=A0ABT8GMW2_9BACL|nr:DUF2085 domain-containing protein [Ureibacillus sp. BA0131]MDN4492741.1 DUF2085 domain-containing protein [Ureibacillus sp. BA0131]
MREFIELIPCHRLPERCLYINGEPMPLCTRCFSMLLGYILMPFALLASVSIPLWIPIAMVIPLLMDGFTQRWKWRTSNNFIRFVTGLLFGIGQSLLISTIVWQIVNWLS